VFVDAWNLAAGLHVQRVRRQAQEERLAADVAAFSYRPGATLNSELQVRSVNTALAVHKQVAS
jgi:hypothetical protein